jgi:mRNA interferase MazF
MRRDGNGRIIAFERGDVVWGLDPFKRDSVEVGASEPDDDTPPRPWLIVSTAVVPFHPDQYLCLTLTTRTWHEDSIPLSPNDWIEGGAPEDSSILPWAIAAIKHEFRT